MVSFQKNVGYKIFFFLFFFFFKFKEDIRPEFWRGGKEREGKVQMINHRIWFNSYVSFW